MTCSIVTGGAGSIGSHLVELLLSKGDRVIVFDDFSTGSLANLAHLTGNPMLEVITGSILDDAVLLDLFKRADRVFHLAAAVGVDLVVEQPAETIRTNIVGTDNVLKACSNHKIPLFVASTSEVYGKSTSIPFAEQTDIVLGPTSKCRWSYACSKVIDEFMTLAHWKECELPVVVGRFFNTAGPRQHGNYGMVIPRFVNQALRHEPLTVYGDGTQSRCFAHVNDIVRAVVKLVETAEAYGQVVNLGTRHTITINELAELIVKMTDSNSDIVHIPFEEAYATGFEDIFAREPDLSRAEKLIEFQPKQELENILSDVILWSRQMTLAPLADKCQKTR